MELTLVSEKFYGSLVDKLDEPLRISPELVMGVVDVKEQEIEFALVNVFSHRINSHEGVQDLIDWLIGWKEKIAELRTKPLEEFEQVLEEMGLGRDWSQVYDFRPCVYHYKDSIYLYEKEWAMGVYSGTLVFQQVEVEIIRQVRPLAVFKEVSLSQLVAPTYYLTEKGKCFGETEMFNIVHSFVPCQYPSRYRLKLNKPDDLISSYELKPPTHLGEVILTASHLLLANKAWKAVEHMVKLTNDRWKEKLQSVLEEEGSE